MNKKISFAVIGIVSFLYSVASFAVVITATSNGNYCYILPSNPYSMAYKVYTTDSNGNGTIEMYQSAQNNTCPPTGNIVGSGTYKMGDITKGDNSMTISISGVCGPSQGTYTADSTGMGDYLLRSFKLSGAPSTCGVTNGTYVPS